MAVIVRTIAIRIVSHFELMSSNAHPHRWIAASYAVKSPDKQEQKYSSGSFKNEDIKNRPNNTIISFLFSVTDSTIHDLMFII